MNKFAIPTILTATIMIAVIFAFVPINEASTSHIAETSSLLSSIIVGSFSTGAVTTAGITDDTIGPEDITGATDTAGLFHVEENSAGAALTVATASHIPVVSSLALVTCNVEGVTADQVTDDGTVTLVASTGSIQQLAARDISELSAVGDQWEGSYHWVVTGIAVAGTMTCNVDDAGSNEITAADVTGIEIIAIYIPE